VDQNLLKVGALMPQQPPLDSSPPQEAWLWIHDLASQRRLATALRRFPTLPELRVAGFYDPRSRACLLRLRFAAGRRRRVALRIWADLSDFGLSETTNWSDDRRAALESEVERFRCTGYEAEAAAIFELSVALVKAGSRRRVARGTVEHVVPSAVAPTAVVVAKRRVPVSRVRSGPYRRRSGTVTTVVVGAIR